MRYAPNLEAVFSVCHHLDQFLWATRSSLCATICFFLGKISSLLQPAALIVKCEVVRDDGGSRSRARRIFAAPTMQR